MRSFVGWYRHITLVMLASAFLVGMGVQAGSPPLASQECPVAPSASTLIALTPSEVRHLLARLFFPASTSVPLVSQWSWWRRTHQYWAGYYHRRRRAKAG